MMSTHWFDGLSQSLHQAGHAPAVWSVKGNSQQHSRLMILPTVGRIIACELPGCETNLFYQHADLQDASKAASLLAKAGGVPGGDRLWIAPESAYMWKDLAKVRHDLPSHAHTPAAMDPAQYTIRQQADGLLEMVTTMALEDDRSKQRLSLRVSRMVSLIDVPDGLPSSLACLSFAITNEVTMLEAGPDVQAGAWDLLQVPPEGVLICPTAGQAVHVRSYYDPFGDHVRVSDAGVHFRIDSRKRVKMGIDPVSTLGRMAYYQQHGHVSSLIVRIFAPQPGQAYVDLPVDDILQGQRTGGDALQAYNHNGGGGLSFGEMEYHDPAVLALSPNRTQRHTSVTHVLAGADGDIREFGQRLLGQPIWNPWLA